MWKGTIVENSLNDNSVLDDVEIEKTWQSDDWVLHNVCIDGKKIDEIGKYLVEGPWYIHFWQVGTDKVFVVFKNKKFEILHSDKTTWGDAIRYGKNLGIPEEQLDFVVPLS
jgi:hypothetical protein